MWHNPRLLNAAADFLLALCAAALLWAGLELLLRSALFPLREITVRGTLAHTARAEIEHAIAQRAAGNFFAADLSALRAGLEALPWVRRVEVRRLWPARIEVTLEEHRALAHWGEAGLVNTYGEPFAARPDEDAAALPLLAGPPGSAPEVARRYRRFAEIVAPLGEAPERVLLTPRHAWQLRLAGGLNLELGRDGAEPVEARLERFVAAWPGSLGRLRRRPVHVDLRYPNGFALRIAE